MVSVFAPFVLFCPSIASFALFALLPLKISPKGAIPPILRTTAVAGALFLCWHLLCCLSLSCNTGSVGYCAVTNHFCVIVLFEYPL